MNNRCTLEAIIAVALVGTATVGRHQSQASLASGHSLSTGLDGLRV